MNDPLARVRAFATLLPGVEERAVDGYPTFLVAEQSFAQVRSDPAESGGIVVRVRTADGLEAQVPDAGPADRDAAGWTAINLDGNPDWTLVEDRVARSWELAAPRGLLEAGGR